MWNKRVAFILAYLTFLACLTYLDWLKGTRFAEKGHGFLIQMKTTFLIIGSVGLIWGFHGKQAGVIFGTLYGFLWLLYWLLQFGIRLLSTQPVWLEFLQELRSVFLAITQLMMPVPVVVFWVLFPIVFPRGKPSSSKTL